MNQKYLKVLRHVILCPKLYFATKLLVQQLCFVLNL